MVSQELPSFKWLGQKAMLLGLFCFFITKSFAQVSDRDFSEVYKSIILKKSRIQWAAFDTSTRKEDSTLMEETQLLLDDLNVFMEEEHRLNGNGKFAFSGNETKSGNLFKVDAGISMDKGIYPYELDFSTNLQTQLKDGTFQENVSDIDISFDFHPIVPDPGKRKKKYEEKIRELKTEMTQPGVYVEEYQREINKYELKMEEPATGNGLWLENYVYAKRFSDDFLGIDNNYAVGGGFIFSLFSKALTDKGIKNRDEMNRKPSYELHGGDLVRCLQNCTPIHNALKLSESELEIISKTRTRYLISNRKQYSKFRFSFLIGAFYELEKTTLNQLVNFNQVDTTISHTFSPTNTIRWEIRPGLVWKPKDKYKFKLYTFVNFPFDNFDEVTTDGTLTDVRLDYFMDIQTSFDIKIEDHFNVGIYYRMIYDNAPNSLILTESNGSKLLVLGEKRRDSFGISLSFDF
ncbi:MAG: hypothetical protein IPM34_14545 [Saprospiraceae bacterium]|nr:hypothetical protein [Saprospiraceae bacterium]